MRRTSGRRRRLAGLPVIARPVVELRPAITFSWLPASGRSLDFWRPALGADLAAVNPADPFSWNRYSYVGNMPLELDDPLGLSTGLNWGADGCLYLDEDTNNGGRIVHSVTLVWCPSDDGPPSLDPQDPSHPTGPAAGGSGSGSGTGSGNNPPQAPAPNNGTSWYHNPCITSALDKGALEVGVDSIGLIPEAGGVARIIGHQAGYVGVVADQFGAKFIDAVGHTGITVQGLNGHHGNHRGSSCTVDSVCPLGHQVGSRAGDSCRRLTGFLPHPLGSCLHWEACGRAEDR